MAGDARMLVTAAYAVLLGREPDSEGMRGWTAQLDRGMTAEALLDAVAASAERATLLETGRGAEVRWRAGEDGAVEVSVELRGGSGLPSLWLSGPLLDRSLICGLAAGGGTWEPEVTAAVLAALQPGDTFLDVGANLGYFTLLGAARVGPSGRVVAVEALERTGRRLLDNIARNALANVSVVGVGLWSGPMSGHAQDVDAVSLGWTRVVPGDPPAWHSHNEQVRCAALDDLIAGGDVDLPACALVKLDIEGSEVHALRGMRATLMRLRPPLIVELNNHALSLQGSRGAQLLDLLGELGYGVQALPAAHQTASLAELGAAEPWPGVVTRISEPERLLALSEQLDAARPPADGLELLALPFPQLRPTSIA